MKRSVFSDIELEFKDRFGEIFHPHERKYVNMSANILSFLECMLFLINEVILKLYIFRRVLRIFKLDFLIVLIIGYSEIS